MDKCKMLENYIFYLAAHQGKRESYEHLELIHSEKKYYNIAIPLQAADIPKIHPKFRIYLPDWLLHDQIVPAHFQPTGKVSFLLLQERNAVPTFSVAIKVRKCCSAEDLESFSLIQGLGLCETDAEFNEWYPLIRSRVFGNKDCNQQNFYIAYNDNRPVGVCLSVDHLGVLGIYAPVTLPDFRKTGVCSALMDHVISDYLANVANNEKIVMAHALSGSYSHHFYEKFGFKNAFECFVYAHASVAVC